MLEGALLILLGVCVLVQTYNKRIGAALIFLWCGALVVYGYLFFTELPESHLTFFGIRIRAWAFYAVVSAIMVYYLAMATRAEKTIEK